jgi:hypothetical protein
MKNILALLADFADGIIAVLIASWVFGVSPVWWYFLVGIPLAMLPDIDAVPEIILRRRVSASDQYARDHRTLLHYPLLSALIFIPVAVFGGFWGFLIATAVGLHLLNDLWGTGWGLPFFWPLQKGHIKFFARRANILKSVLVERGEWDSLPLSERRLRFVTYWSEAELPSYIRKYGIDGWITPYYLRFNWICALEYLIFTAAVILMVFSLI